MTFTKALIGLAAVAAFSGAQATSIVSAAQPSPATPITFNSSNVGLFGGAAALPNSYSFALSAATPSVFSLTTNYAALFGTVNISSISLSQTFGGSYAQTISTPAMDTVTFGGLSAGSYTLSFATSGSGFLIGSAGFTATPVPEAETLALALAGLGVVGMLRRRRA
jgi:MYXO-CTERM domain-containing protein